MTTPASTLDRVGTAIVVGASRGLGRAIAVAVAAGGSRVVAVSRTAPEPIAPAPTTGAGAVLTEIADAADPSVPEALLDRHDPDTVVLVAGAVPDTRPLPEQTWESFSAHWHGEVQISFRWLGAILRRPLRPGSTVITVSSGAALAGSPLSGGYAGAKAMQRFLSDYARDEAGRAGLDIAFTAVLPQFAPEAAVGAAGVAAYAARAGLPTDEFLAGLPFPVLTPAIAGAAVVELLHTDHATLSPAYLLNGAGLRPLPA